MTYERRGHRMGTSDGGFATLRDLHRWCSRAPEGTRLDARELAGILADIAPEERPDPSEAEPVKPAEPTWRERLWTVPAETRLGTVELAEGLGRPRSWIYSRTQADAEDPLPHRKLEGALVFTAGEVRAWLRDHEETVVGWRSEPTAEERRLHAL